MAKLTDKQIIGICKHVVDIGDYDKFWISRHYIENTIESFKEATYVQRNTSRV